MAAKYVGKHIVFASKGAVEIRRWEQEPPAAGCAMVENVCSLISAGTELSRLYDYHTVRRPFPMNTGYISVGRVAALGDGVSGLREGQLVVAPMGHISHLAVEPGRLLPVPEGLTAEDAVFAPIAAISLRAVRQAAIQLGDSVLVMGMGLIGQFAQIFARLSGGHPVVGADMSEFRLEIAARTGLRHALNAGSADFDTALAAAAPEGRFRASIDSTGTPDAIAGLPARTARFGTIVVLGGVHRKVELDLYSFFQKGTQRIVGAGEPDPRDFPYDEAENQRTVLRLMKDGRLDVRPLRTHLVDVEQAPEMYRMLHEQKNAAMGVVFRWRT